MMAASASHWKLGLFVIVGMVVGFSALVWLGAAEFDREVTYYVTYFDESVQGLDLGSPVKFRGVTIGNVERISIAPDRRHVEVETEVNVKVLRKMGLDSETLHAPKDLRMQLASAGVTGLKFMQVDFFDPDDHPAPELPFPTPDNYVPATPSSLKSLEDSVVQAVGRFPETTQEAIGMLKRINVLLDDINEQKIPARLTETITKVNDAVDQAKGTLSTAQYKVYQVDVETISDNIVLFTENLIELTGKASLTLDNINGSLARINRLIGRFEREGGMLEDVEATIKILRTEAKQLEGTMALVKGTMTSVKGTADAFSDMARDASELTDDIGTTLRSISEVADGIRRLADVLERDPDALLKGRTRSTP